MIFNTRNLSVIAAVALNIAAAPAQAGLSLSKVILDFGPGAPPRDDVELSNDGPDRLYVVAEPSEIVDPGLATETRRPGADPAQSGLLVTPQKLILEPGEHKLVRIAAVGARPVRDRVYRVTIKPVGGPVAADQSALKLFIGYDVLVVHRPEQPTFNLASSRNGTALTVRNSGNSNVELARGHQCDPSGSACKDLPANRLYPGQTWTIDTPWRTPVTYQRHFVGEQTIVQF